jgi:hypothetical protein
LNGGVGGDFKHGSTGAGRWPITAGQAIGMSNISAMTPARYRRLRNGYVYPAVGLLVTHLGQIAHRSYASAQAMEVSIQRLLRSEDANDVLLGYLSVIYWGHYSAQTSDVRPGWAMAKVHRTLRTMAFIDATAYDVGSVVRKSDRHIERGKYGEAVLQLTSLPQLGFAFASKVCALLSPSSCGVIDSVLAGKHPTFGFALTQRGARQYVATTPPNRTKYDAYCRFLIREAERVNGAGAQFRWTDHDGSRRIWRAIDIERALYGANPRH